MLPISRSATRAATTAVSTAPAPPQHWRLEDADVTVFILLAGFMEAVWWLLVMILR